MVKIKPINNLKLIKSIIIILKKYIILNETIIIIKKYINLINKTKNKMKRI